MPIPYSSHRFEHVRMYQRPAAYGPPVEGSGSWLGIGIGGHGNTGSSICMGVVSRVLRPYGRQQGIPQGACFYARWRQDIPDWGPTIDSTAVVEDFFHLADQIWDYAPEIVDAGMTDKFAALFVACTVARISDLVEMIPAFDDDKDDQPERLGRRGEAGEEGLTFFPRCLRDLLAGTYSLFSELFLRSFIKAIYLCARSARHQFIRPTNMPSFSSSHQHGGDRSGFSGIEPPFKRKKVSESSRFYDVFINHRGPDVKNTLALELSKSLEKLRIVAFLDSEEKQLGNSFTSTIETAIRSAVALFPLFKKRYTEKLREWKEALQSVSFIVGEELNRDCEKIVSTVQREVQRMRCLHVAKYPVGLSKLVEHFEEHCIDKLVQDFESLCKMNKQREGKAKIVGIFGMSGVGKTTLCKELFNRKRLDYCRSCFLFDVREGSVERDLPSLQLKLLRELFDEKDHQSFASIDDCTSCLSNCFARSSNLRFLIVLDDIDQQEQLDAFLISDELNNCGNSLIIVTTRDIGVLINAGITVGYNFKGMDANDAKELFCLHAFSQSYPSSGYEELVDSFVHVCGGLPLSIQVLGRHVHGQDQKFWELELKKAKKTLPQDIHKRLRISIETLDSEEKQIFMDVACFFIGALKKDAIRVWEGSGWSAQHALRKLKNKCLVEELEDQKFRGQFKDLLEDSREENFVLRMHYHLRDLGREMADELSHLRRLWRSQHLQSLNLQSLSIIGGSLERLWQNNEQEPIALKELRIRSISELKELSLGLLSCLEKFTIYNCWHLKSMTGITDLTKLVELNISKLSYLEKLIELNISGCEKIEELSLVRLNCVEKIKISDCSDLKSVEGISNLRKLVELQIEKCPKLEEISFVQLGFLQNITISNCQMLKSLKGINDLAKLVELNISKCEELKELSLVQHSCLEKLSISNSLNLQSVTVSHLEKLVELNVSGCEKMKKLSLVQLSRLEKIKISHCPGLKSVSGIYDLKKVVELQIEKCPKLEGVNFVQLRFLENITVFDYQKLKSLKGLNGLTKLVELNISKFQELEELNLVGHGCLEKLRIFNSLNLHSVTVSHLQKLIELNISSCQKIEELSHVQLNCLEKIRISDCPYLKSVAGMSDLRKSVTVSHLRNLVELKFINYVNIKELSLVQLSRLRRIKILGSLTVKIIEVKGCKILSRVDFENLKNVVKLSIYDCPELENLPELVNLHQLKMVSLHNCPKLKKITLPTTLIKFTLQCCRELQTVAGIYDCTDVEELVISKCPELEFDELSFARLCWLKKIAIDSCGKMQIITVNEENLVFINRQIYLFFTQKLPSDFIQVVGRAVDGAESNLNASFFCTKYISANSVIQISSDQICPDDLVSAIIICAVVVVNTCSAANMINDFMAEI
ncbi:disease resistance protein Roq1-like [Cryptomeria japonica]|uniref:disease resistance protein Roq1-like n=1 Tax=Cryptomeria japonica TaxID=3369 RepID=UPI0027DA34F9|nr:disease resistance protein Roq1-like [Cryptomeria japonica]